MATDAQVRTWLQNNPNASDAEIAQAAKTAGVTADQLNRVTGIPVEEIQQRTTTALLGRSPTTVEEQNTARLLTDTEKTVQGVINKDVAALADYFKDQRKQGAQVNPDYFTDELGYSYDDLVIAQGVAMAKEERDQLAAEGKDTSEFDKVLDTQPPAVIYGQYIDYKGDDNLPHVALRDETLAFEAKGASGDRIGDPGQFNNSGINKIADPLKNYAKYLLDNPEEIAKVIALSYAGQISPVLGQINEAYQLVSDPMSAATSFIGGKVTGDLIGQAGSELFDDPALQGLASGLVSAGVQEALGGDPAKAFAQELKGTAVDLLPEGIVGEGGLLSDIDFPDITLPDISIPDVNVPSLALNVPSMSIDGLLSGVDIGGLPSVTLPSVNIGATLPSVSLPEVSLGQLPSVTLPSVDLPDVTLPLPELPQIGGTTPTVPSVGGPSVNIPLPTIPRPSFEFGDFTIPQPEYASLEMDEDLTEGEDFTEPSITRISRVVLGA